jgi:hypothetical protein
MRESIYLGVYIHLLHGIGKPFFVEVFTNNPLAIDESGAYSIRNHAAIPLPRGLVLRVSHPHSRKEMTA